MNTFRPTFGPPAWWLSLWVLCLGAVTMRASEMGASPSVEYEFYLWERELPKSDSDSYERNAIIMALKLRPTSCIAFKCTRTRMALQAVVEPLSVYGAKLLVLDENGGVRWMGPTIETRSDDELNVMCPEIGVRETLFLRYPLHKRDLAELLGHEERDIEIPIVRQLALGLELFGFEEGRLKSLGFLTSEPFFVRITEDDFEIRSIPFPENAPEKTP